MGDGLGGGRTVAPSLIINDGAAQHGGPEAFGVVQSADRVVVRATKGRDAVSGGVIRTNDATCAQAASASVAPSCSSTVLMEVLAMQIMVICFAPEARGDLMSSRQEQVVHLIKRVNISFPIIGNCEAFAHRASPSLISQDQSY